MIIFSETLCKALFRPLLPLRPLWYFCLAAPEGFLFALRADPARSANIKEPAAERPFSWPTPRLPLSFDSFAQA